MKLLSFALANLLTIIFIWISAIIGLTTHKWINEWWFGVIWVGCQLFIYAALHHEPKTDRERRPWLYHK